MGNQTKINREIPKLIFVENSLSDRATTLFVQIALL